MMDDSGKQKASDRLAQAASDWEAGRMKLPDAANEEFIPLPGQPGAARPGDVVNRSLCRLAPSHRFRC